MSKFYNSKFYSKPIEVENIDGEVIVIITDDFGRETIYTWYDIIEKNSQSIYINKCLLGGFIKKIPIDVLIIGFGGGAFAKYLEDHIKNINITGIEIDPIMVEIAKRELKVKTNDIYIEDVRNALNKISIENKKYDLILIDIYGSDGEIPNFLEEKNFLLQIKNVLKYDGTISINFSNYTKENQKRFKMYEKIHSQLVEIFGKYYTHFLSGKNDRGNVVGIYNLDKFYIAGDYYDNYMKKVDNGEISYEGEIIKNIVIDNID